MWRDLRKWLFVFIWHKGRLVQLLLSCSLYLLLCAYFWNCLLIFWLFHLLVWDINALLFRSISALLCETGLFIHIKQCLSSLFKLIRRNLLLWCHFRKSLIIFLYRTCRRLPLTHTIWDYLLLTLIFGRDWSRWQSKHLLIYLLSFPWFWLLWQFDRWLVWLCLC